VTTDPFVVYTSNVFALLGMRALYFLLAGAAARLRYLRPGLAVILGAVAAKLLLADVYEFPTWSAPVFIAAVLSVVAAASILDNRRRAVPQPASAVQQPAGAAPRPAADARQPAAPMRSGLVGQAGTSASAPRVAAQACRSRSDACAISPTSTTATT